MAKKYDIEVNVDVTEDLGLQAEGKYKGSKFLGKATKEAVKFVLEGLGESIAKAMSKTDTETTDDKNEVEATEEVEEEILV